MYISELVSGNFDLLSVGVAITGIALLGILIYLNNRQSATNRAFFFFAILTAIWGVSNYLEYRFTTIDATLWALRFHLFISVFHAYAFFTLAYVFPLPAIVFPKWYRFVLTPVVVLTALLTLTPAVFPSIQALAPVGQVTRATPAPGILIFMLVAFVLLLSALIVLGVKTYRAQGLERRQSLSILMGMACTAVLLLVFNVVLPNVFSNLSFIPLAALFTLPFIAFTSYTIYRHHWLNLRVATTALLGFMVTVFSFVNIIFATDLSAIAINVTAFVIVLLGSVKIVRDTLALQIVNEERSEFMSFASHEIRNPITAMRGYASLITDGTTGDVSATTKDVAQKILVQGNDVLNLIAQYLSKSKMELGQISYAKTPFDMGALVESIASGYKPHAEQKGLFLHSELDASQKYMVVGDEGKVKEVIGNIVDNSLKYTKQGGITISVERHGVSIRAVISDTGVGIPPETLPQLFKKFSRADAQKVNLLGTGIGLYLAKTFIEAQGAHIWAESDGKDKGSRFIIEFPSK